jgi:putative membrane protein
VAPKSFSIHAVLRQLPRESGANRDRLMAAAGSPYRWSLEPGVLAAIVTAAGVYAWRLRQLGDRGELTGTDWLRATAFAGGLAVLLLALVSPIDSLGEERLFSVHMAQHLLLVDIVPILVLLGLSRRIARPLVRRARPIEQSLGVVAGPITALVLLVAVIWGWHLRVTYELALNHAWVHQLEHMSFPAAGIGFWWYVIEPVPARHGMRGMSMLAYLASAKLLLGALGVALAFSPDSIYGAYENAPRTWGLSAVEDLNIGGLVMLLEQSIVLLIFFAILFVRMIERSERDQRRREQLGV